MNQPNLHNNSIFDWVDCLYYNVYDSIIDERLRQSQPYQCELILYCMQDQNALTRAIPSTRQGKPYTFYQLHRNNITSEELYSWSTFIDVVEDYEIYLNSKIKTSEISQSVFYNCSLGWFGRTCQYTFIKGLSFVRPTFIDFVTQVFDVKRTASELLYPNPSDHTIYSCYTHIKCERDLPEICLDWREICDGKVDCVNGGQDEMFCAELEISDCAENEYRCHYGGQCIPKEMFHDDEFNSDCLDGTDEPEPFFDSICVGDPSFHCEERSCRYSLWFSCGDGQCIQQPFFFVIDSNDNEGQYCLNGRHRFVHQISLSREANSMITYDCWEAMFCYYDSESKLFSMSNCFQHPCTNRILTTTCAKTIMNSCQTTPQFVFPQSSLAFLAEIDLVYDISFLLNYTEKYWKPSYICFRNQRCSEFFNSSIEIANKSACQRIPYSFGDYSRMFIMGDSWYYGLINLVRTCMTIDRTAFNMTHCLANNLVHCRFNQRCISKYRLLDSIGDCFSNADERDILKETSCSVNQKYRIECLEKQYFIITKRCLSPILTIYPFYTCLNMTSEVNSTEKTQIQVPPFSYLCDRFVDIDAIDNETDETHCENWLCDNVYTRCDGVWNCLNGIDESNCKGSPCPSYTHPCLLPANNTMICLPLSKVNDNHIDCRGATDERWFCQQLYPSYTTSRYKCWNDSKCINTRHLCNLEPDHPYGRDQFIDCDLHEDDEQFCPTHYTPYSICEPEYSDDRTIKEKILCDLAEKYPRGSDRLYREDLHLKLTYSGYYPTDLSDKKEITFDMSQNSSIKLIQFNKPALPEIDFETAWFCNRGIPIMVSSQRYSMCLCPPSYYGNRCQYQNQRVSLTLQFHTIHSPFMWRTIVFQFFIMLVDEENTIQSYEQITYSPIRDCNIKYNIYLLFKDRPKNQSKTYNVRIDAYIMNNLTYHGSWYLSIPFPFLPVNRLASIVTIPLRAQQIQNDCDENICGKHGRCIYYFSSNNFFCQCDTNWKGRWCHLKRHSDDKCRCSPNSLCIEPGICLCTLNRFGSRCYLTRSSCKLNSCSNRGLCLSDDQRISESNFTCICNEGYWGKECEKISTFVDIFFSNIPIPQAIYAHLIRAYENNTAAHQRITTFTKIPLDRNFVTLKISSLFNILFIEFDKAYYLAVIQEEILFRNYIRTEINPSRQCLSIDKLLNSLELTLSILHRVKYYHRICQNHQQFSCFYDDIYMCLCNLERQANCFSFDHNMTYDCAGRFYCENHAQCYQDHPTCPKQLLCACPDCFYGAQCQFSTKDSSFSMDIILAYHIRPHVSFADQSFPVKVSLAITSVIVCLGLINGICSVMTFANKRFYQVGCGIYLIANSTVSFFPIIMIAFKLTSLILTQTFAIKNRTYILISCILIDFLLDTTLNIGNWLNACVAIERAINICRGVKFNKNRSKKIAKWTIVILILFIILTALHKPFYRELINDEDQYDRRTLCVVTYSPWIKQYDITINIIHLFTPFIINIISAFVIIIIAARKRSSAQTHLTRKQHLKKQLDEHKHLLISPIILVLLALPRLILVLFSGCMKSVRNPWFFLTGYFVSTLPSISIFITFALPSKMYRKSFTEKTRQFLTTSNT